MRKETRRDIQIVRVTEKHRDIHTDTETVRQSHRERHRDISTQIYRE